MATYRELKAQLARLESEAAAIRQQEYEAVLADIREKVVEWSANRFPRRARMSGSLLAWGDDGSLRIGKAWFSP